MNSTHFNPDIQIYLFLKNMHFHYNYTYCHFPCTYLNETKEKLISHLHVISGWRKDCNSKLTLWYGNKVYIIFGMLLKLAKVARICHLSLKFNIHVTLKLKRTYTKLKLVISIQSLLLFQSGSYKDISQYRKIISCFI